MHQHINEEQQNDAPEQSGTKQTEKTMQRVVEFRECTAEFVCITHCADCLLLGIVSGDALRTQSAQPVVEVRTQFAAHCAILTYS